MNKLTTLTGHEVVKNGSGRCHLGKRTYGRVRESSSSQIVVDKFVAWIVGGLRRNQNLVRCALGSGGQI